jgi:hypothetical protein
MLLILVQNGGHFGKNQNFQKRLCKFLDNHKMKLWYEFQPNRTTTAAKTLYAAEKK